MRSSKRWLATFAAGGLLAFTTTMAWLWPAETHADDPAAQLAQQRAFAPSEAKIDGLLASSKLVEDPKHKGRWFVEVEVQNDTGEARSAEVEAVLTEVDFQPMARVMPMPRAVWHERAEVSVGSGERAVRRFPIPAEVCRRIGTNAGKKDGPMAARTRFDARVRPVHGAS